LRNIMGDKFREERSRKENIGIRNVLPETEVVEEEVEYWQNELDNYEVNQEWIENVSASDVPDSKIKAEISVLKDIIKNIKEAEKTWEQGDINDSKMYFNWECNLLKEKIELGRTIKSFKPIFISESRYMGRAIDYNRAMPGVALNLAEKEAKTKASQWSSLKNVEFKEINKNLTPAIDWLITKYSYSEVSSFLMYVSSSGKTRAGPSENLHSAFIPDKGWFINEKELQNPFQLSLSFIHEFGAYLGQSHEDNLANEKEFAQTFMRTYPIFANLAFNFGDKVYSLGVIKYEYDVKSEEMIFYFDSATQAMIKANLPYDALPYEVKQFNPAALIIVPDQDAKWMLAGSAQARDYIDDSKGGNSPINLVLERNGDTRVEETAGGKKYNGSVAVGVYLQRAGYDLSFKIAGTKDDVVVKPAGSVVTHIDANGNQRQERYSDLRTVRSQTISGKGIINYGDYQIVLNNSTDELTFDLGYLGQEGVLSCDGQVYGSFLDLPKVKEVRLKTNRVGSIELEEEVIVITQKVKEGDIYKHQVTIKSDKNQIAIKGAIDSLGNPCHITIDDEGRIVPQGFEGEIALKDNIEARGEISVNEDGTLTISAGTRVRFLETNSRMEFIDGPVKFGASGLFIPITENQKGVYIPNKGKAVEFVSYKVKAGDGQDAYLFGLGTSLNKEVKGVFYEDRKKDGQIEKVKREITVKKSAPGKIMLARDIDSIGLSSLKVENNQPSYEVKEVSLAKDEMELALVIDTRGLSFDLKEGPVYIHDRFGIRQAFASEGGVFDKSTEKEIKVRGQVNNITVIDEKGENKTIGYEIAPGKDGKPAYFYVKNGVYTVRGFGAQYLDGSVVDGAKIAGTAKMKKVGEELSLVPVDRGSKVTYSAKMIDGLGADEVVVECRLNSKSMPEYNYFSSTTKKFIIDNDREATLKLNGEFYKAVLNKEGFIEFRDKNDKAGVKT
ncbi:MAG: hypothetical protein ABIH71_06295, partial [Candidatus Omnitrophota bacterium]